MNVWTHMVASLPLFWLSWGKCRLLYTGPSVLGKTWRIMVLIWAVCCAKVGKSFPLCHKFCLFLILFVFEMLQDLLSSHFLLRVQERWTSLEKHENHWPSFGRRHKLIVLPNCFFHWLVLASYLCFTTCGYCWVLDQLIPYQLPPINYSSHYFSG